MIADIAFALLTDASEEALLDAIEEKQGRAVEGPPPTRPSGVMVSVGFGQAVGSFPRQSQRLALSGSIFAPVVVSVGVGYRFVLSRTVDFRTGAFLSYARSTSTVDGSGLPGSRAFFSWRGADIVTIGAEATVRLRTSGTAGGFVGLGTRAGFRTVSTGESHSYSSDAVASVVVRDVAVEGLLELGVESGVHHRFETVFRGGAGPTTSGQYTASFGIALGYVF